MKEKHSAVERDPLNLNWLSSPPKKDILEEERTQMEILRNKLRDFIVYKMFFFLTGNAYYSFCMSEAGMGDACMF